MTIQLSQIANQNRLLFSIPLKPVHGQRFQPTGFPGLGAAVYNTPKGQTILVESAQSMANRLEQTIWDDAKRDLNSDCMGLSHVRIKRKGSFLTDTVLESHRLNSPYLLESSNKSFLDELKGALGTLGEGPIDRVKLCNAILTYDVGALLHGLFLAKKELAGGRLRIARAISAFIEADGVRVAASGGVKNDHVNPSGDTGKGYGNVPFARDEYVADSITLYVNLDLAQIRGYGLGPDVETLLITLALYKLRALVDGTMRLRTACDLELSEAEVRASRPSNFVLPDLQALRTALSASIKAVSAKMKVTETTFDDELKKGKDEKKADSDASETESQ
jgi:CRISPR-associated protein Csb1